MSGFNFADSYKAAGLTPGPEIIGLRQGPFDKLCEKMDMHMAVDLTRFYFGLPVPLETSEWFRDAFGETDASFSMLDNEREVAVLSACLLSAAINDNEEVAALAILTVSADGNREPIILAELIEDARIALINNARDNRHHQAVDLEQAKTNIHDAAAALVATPDLDKTVQCSKQMTDVIVEVLLPLADQVADLREEVAMLWWHIGGWSRILDKPFVGLEAGLSAAMAGLDLADLSRTFTGPAAASAILHRTVSAGRTDNSVKASIKDAVDAFPPEVYEKLKLGNKLQSVMDICPVLAGFLKAHEVGESPAWEKAFQRAVHLNPSVSFNLLNLAVQVYRERSLLAAID